MISDNRLAILIFCVVCVLVGVAIGVALMDNINYYNSNNNFNGQTLNAYATFESACHYRGYDRNECLLIWSGRQ